MIEWHCKAFAELTVHELYMILQQRAAVFVVEQTCPYLDSDGADPQAIHLWATEGIQLVGYARVFIGTSTTGYSRIGRVLTTANGRGRGIGREVMRRAIELCHTHAPTLPIRLSAQVYLHDFYASFGFVDISAEYLEDGIPHIDMELQQ